MVPVLKEDYYFVEFGPHVGLKIGDEIYPYRNAKPKEDYPAPKELRFCDKAYLTEVYLSRINAGMGFYVNGHPVGSEERPKIGWAIEKLDKKISASGYLYAGADLFYNYLYDVIYGGALYYGEASPLITTDDNISESGSGVQGNPMLLKDKTLEDAEKLWFPSYYTLPIWAKKVNPTKGVFLNIGTSMGDLSEIFGMRGDRLLGQWNIGDTTDWTHPQSVQDAYIECADDLLKLKWAYTDVGTVPFDTEVNNHKAYTTKHNLVYKKHCSMRYPQQCAVPIDTPINSPTLVFYHFKQGIYEMEGEDIPKTATWKDNHDGTWTLKICTDKEDKSEGVLATDFEYEGYCAYDSTWFTTDVIPPSKGAEKCSLYVTGDITTSYTVLKDNKVGYEGVYEKGIFLWPITADLDHEAPPGRGCDFNRKLMAYMRKAAPYEPYAGPQMVNVNLSIKDSYGAIHSAGDDSQQIEVVFKNELAYVSITIKKIYAVVQLRDLDYDTDKSK